MPKEFPIRLIFNSKKSKYTIVSLSVIMGSCQLTAIQKSEYSYNSSAVSLVTNGFKVQKPLLPHSKSEPA